VNILWFNLKIDEEDQVLSFALDWINKLSLRVNKIIVITLEKGEYTLNDNVIVYSIGKEKGYSKLRRVIVFYKLLFKVLKKEKIDVVFSHMMPLFVAMSGFILKLTKKPIYQWYCHKSATKILRIACFFSDKIFTCSEISMNIETTKKKVIGHGINLDIFKQLGIERERETFLCVGRISPIKNVHILVEVVDLLVKEGHKNLTLLIVGEPTTQKKDIDYKSKIVKSINEKKLSDNIIFTGTKDFNSMVELYNKSKFLLSLSDTGSVDKVFLEAMACGCIPISSNDSFKLIFKDLYPELIVRKDATDIFNKVNYLLSLKDNEIVDIQNTLNNEVKNGYSLEGIVQVLFKSFSKIDLDRVH